MTLLAKGLCRLEELPLAEDVISTMRAIEMLGVVIVEHDIAEDGRFLSLQCDSSGLSRSYFADIALPCGNSGTTMRLLSGMLAGEDGCFHFSGDRSLSRRPMLRILEPLAQMGADIEFLLQHGCAPFVVRGTPLTGQSFDITVASAQVQSGLLLAGLHADGPTTVNLSYPVRDHLVRMFRHLQVNYEQEQETRVTVRKLSSSLPPFTISIPGDLSSAMFLIAAATLIPGSDICLLGVGTNPFRREALNLLGEMGACIEETNRRICCEEPVSDLHVKYAPELRGVRVGPERIAGLIDELPILAVVAACARGDFIVEGASELRVKESDRLAAIVTNLQAAGVICRELADGFLVSGKGRIPGQSMWRSFQDHRMAMSGIICALVAEKPLEIDDTVPIAVSYPTFLADLDYLSSAAS